MIMRKCKLIILEAIVAIILLCTRVYAAINVNLSFRVTNRELKPGEEFKIRLTLNNIKLDNNSGITDIEGYINYNENVIEKVTAASITKNDDGKVVVGDQILDFEDLTNLDPNEMSSSLEGIVAFNGNPASGNDSKIIIGLKEPITESTQVLEVTFKVKEDAVPGQVDDAVEYSLFEVAAGEEKTDTISQVIPITVLGTTTENTVDNTVNNTVENKTNNTVNNTVENKVNNTVNNTVENKVNNTVNNAVENKVNNAVNNTVKNTVNNKVNNTVNNTTKNTVNNTTNKVNNTTNNSVKSTNNGVDNTVASSTLPKTGASMIIVPIAGLIVVAYIAYNRYMKYKEVD